MSTDKEDYLRSGFVEIPTDSGTGSTVLVNRERGRVVKFSFDPAYDRFAEIAHASPRAAFPRIYERRQATIDNGPIATFDFLIVEMELLVPLDPSQGDAVVAWTRERLARFTPGNSRPEEPHDDRFGILKSFDELLAFAVSNRLGLDLVKASNYMGRLVDGITQVVITDPFN